MKDKQINWAFWIAGQAGVVPYAEGPPGVGKTAMTKQLARMTGRRFLGVYLDQMIPEDLRGFPVPSEVQIDGVSHRVMKQLLDEQFLMAKFTPSVMLIDELTCVGESMQAAALSWMCSPPKNCWTYSAGNPVEMAASGTALADAMINRLCMMKWEVDTESWATGMTAGGGVEFPLANLPLLPEGWEEGTAVYSGKANIFCNSTDTQLSRPEYLSKPPEKDEDRGLPFPSPRAWTNLCVLLGAADSVGANHKTKRTLACGCVGDGIGQEFLDFLQLENLKSPEEILADPLNVDVPKQCNMAMSYIGSVFRRVREFNTPKRWENARVFLASCHDQHPEQAQAWKGKLWKIKPDGHQPEYNEYFADMESGRVHDLDGEEAERASSTPF